MKNKLKVVRMILITLLINAHTLLAIKMLKIHLITASSILASLGSILNTSAFVSNGGMMPVKSEKVRKDGIHKKIDEKTRLKFLTDVIEIRGTIYSVGDILSRLSIIIGITGIITEILIQIVR